MVELESTPFGQRRLVFVLIVALYVLDCGTDWNLYVSIRSYTRDSEAFFGEQFAQGHDGDLGCTCTCGDDGFCEETATSGTTAASVCVGLANYFSSRGSEPKYCDVPHLMQESANPGATPCGTQYDVAATRSDLRFLEAISWAILAVNICTTIGTVIYLLWYSTYRVSPPAQVGGVDTKSSDTDLDKINRAEEGEVDHTVFDPNNPLRYIENCPSCGEPLGHKRFCPECGFKVADAPAAHSKEMKMQRWIQGFQMIAHIRVAFLAFEDVPQLILLLNFFSTVDSPTGLGCQRCVLEEGPACLYDSAFPTQTLVVSLIGTGASLLVLFIQAVATTVVTQRQGIAEAGKRIHVCGVEASFSILVIAGCVGAPILLYLAHSEMSLILGLSKGWISGLTAIACVLLSFPFFFFLIIFIYVTERCEFFEECECCANSADIGSAGDSLCCDCCGGCLPDCCQCNLCDCCC